MNIEQDKLAQAAAQTMAEESKDSYNNSGASIIKRGNTERKEKGSVSSALNNEAFNTQENFNTCSNNSEISEDKAAATDDRLSIQESNQDEAFTMIGFGGDSNDFNKITA